jgi:adenine-specific DNA-methyltransferase
VLKLDALLAGGEQAGQAWLQVLGCLRDVAVEIITFLASVENFQKRLYEKRKFVTNCRWCCTLDHIERAGLIDPLVKVLNATEGGKAQKAEWKELFAIDKVKTEDGAPRWKDKVTPEFLRSQPYLVLDTKFIPQDLTDQLLASATSPRFQ